MAENVRVKAIRSFYFHKEIIKKDKEVELPAFFAAEVISSKKAVRVIREPIPPTPTEVAPQPHKIVEKKEPPAKGGEK